MSPARTRPTCAAPGCRQSHTEGSSLCDDHAYGRRPWRADRDLGPRRLCTVDGCENVHYAHGFCKLHYERQQRAGVQFPPAEPWNPYYADLPCPSCGSRATVPFDPRPERAGRGPSTDLATCVVCHHTWSLASSPSVAPSPEAAGGENGGEREPRSHTKVPGGLASAAVAPTKSTDPSRTTRGRRNVATAMATDRTA